MTTAVLATLLVFDSVFDAEGIQVIKTRRGRPGQKRSASALSTRYAVNSWTRS
jgi:hypothetical protein